MNSNSTLTCGHWINAVALAIQDTNVDIIMNALFNVESSNKTCIKVHTDTVHLTGYSNSVITHGIHSHDGMLIEFI